MSDKKYFSFFIFLISIILLFFLNSCSSSPPAELSIQLIVYYDRDNNVTLLWEDASMFDTFFVYRIEKGERTWENQWELIATTSDYSYVDDTAKPNQMYEYKINAYNTYRDILGREKYNYLESQEVCTGYIKISGELDAEGFKLSWTSNLEDVHEYKVMRASEANGNYETIGTTATTTFLDNSPKEGSRYKVLAQIDDNGDSYLAEAVLPFHRLTWSAPYDISITCQDAFSAVILFSFDSDADGFLVFRSKFEDIGYEEIADIPTKGYIDTDIDNEQNYFYRIQAYSVLEDDVFYGPLSNPVATGTNARNVSRFAALMYHQIYTQEEIDAGALNDNGTILYEEFESDLKWLSENGYTTITPKDLLSYWRGNINSLPEKCVMITFDDGSWCVYQHAYPLLQKYNMKAVLNVIGDRIDSAMKHDRTTISHPFCNWDEIGEMGRSGYIEIGSHTYYLHWKNEGERYGTQIMTGETVEGYRSALTGDMLSLNAIINEHCGYAPIAFAYPYSRVSRESIPIFVEDCKYEVLLAGDGDSVKPTRLNCYVDGSEIDVLSSRLIK